MSVTVSALIVGGLFYFWGWEDGKNSTDDEPERVVMRSRKGRGLTTPAHGPARTRG